MPPPPAHGSAGGATHPRLRALPTAADDEDCESPSRSESKSEPEPERDDRRDATRQTRRRNREDRRKAGPKRRRKRSPRDGAGAPRDRPTDPPAGGGGGGGDLPGPPPTVRVVPLAWDGQPDVVDGSSARAGEPRPRWIRVVDPYPHSFSSFAKERWIGRTVLDVYSTEFGSYPPSYYREAIAQGRITVRGQRVPPEHVVQRTDVLRHAVHRHEPAVHVASPHPPHVDVVHDGPDCLVVDKPGSLPVHPCGGYHLNSLMPLLQHPQPPHLRAANRLYTIHRLDRLTSGLVVLAKSPAVAATWAQAIKGRECQKLYLARVKGRFPEGLSRPPAAPAGTEIPRLDPPDLPVHGERTGAAPQSHAAHERNAHGWWITDVRDDPRPDAAPEDCAASASPAHGVVDDWLQAVARERNDAGQGEEVPAFPAGSSRMLWLHLACPTRVVDPKNGVCDCGTFAGLDAAAYRATVKAAQTSFAALKYDAPSDTTLLLCRPQTGRTHQIRVHLRHLGHPIANDPNYGGALWYGDPAGQEACRRAQELLAGTTDAFEERDGGDGPQSQSATPPLLPPPPSGLVTSDEPATEGEVQRCVVGLPPRSGDEPLDDFLRRTCVWCARNRAGRADRAALELLVRSPGIWLHALQYSVVLQHQRIVYRTKLPGWSTF